MTKEILQLTRITRTERRICEFFVQKNLNFCVYILFILCSSDYVINQGITKIP